MTPRSVRANNPLNIRVGDAWQGLVSRERMTPEQAAETAFCVFSEPAWGFRAAAICIRNAVRSGAVKTLSDLIYRWAPPTENQTAAYVESVSKRSGVAKDSKIDPDRFEQIFAIIKAMARHETGAWDGYWTDDELREGLNRAGIMQGEGP